MTALLRFAALPLTELRDAASPGLFRQLDDLVTRERRLADHTAPLAERIGHDLVPAAALTGPQRALALRVRRALHGGTPDADDLDTLAGAAAHLNPDLAAELAALAGLARDLDRARTRWDDALARERERLLGLPWQVLHRTPAGRQALAGSAVAADVGRRLAHDEPWTSKRMRQRSDFLWRMLARGSTRATPKGWLAHVAPLPATDGGWQAGTVLTIEPTAATETVQNFAGAREQSTAPGALLSAAPLAWNDTDALRVWRVEGTDPPRLRQLAVRRTPAMAAVWSLVQQQPAPVRDVVRNLAGDDPRSRQVLLDFVHHLVGLGVLHLSAPPRAVHSPWTPLDAPRPAPPADGHAYTDVYRPAAAGIDPGHRRLLTGALHAALRLMALTDLDSRPAARDLPAAIGAEPRPLLEIVARCLDAGDPPPAHAAHRHDWPAAADPDSPYGRLVSWITARLDDGHDTVDIPYELLTQAPPQPVDWPTDVLLRPLAAPDGPVAVLADLAPAGVLDARFAPALRQLDRDLPQVDDYRAFLRRTSAQAGTPYVELLIPPLTAMAANAVRRPAYTTWWTGDPDPTGYFPQGTPDQAAFLPLSDITLHAAGGRVVATGPHGPIWPVCHSVRVPQPPWDTIRDLLQRASPQDDRRHWRPLYYSLPGWPERRHMPRLTLGGVLVISPAQWRIPRADLPARAHSPAQQIRTVHRLRRQLRLPRWITVAADPHDDPTVIDLESLHFVRLLADLPGAQDTIWAAELLPDPGQAPVRDESVTGGGHLAELLFRIDPTTATVPAEPPPATPPTSRDRGQRRATAANTPKGGTQWRPPTSS